MQSDELMAQPLKYTTIAMATTGDFRDRGSKFFSFAYPVRTPREVKEHLAGLKKAHPKAVHHCFAYRLGADKNNFRAVDDGEPAGSAGRPILNAIDSEGLSNVLVVVVRYFGGTLLGVPGLIHAYKTATQLALQEAEKVAHWIEQDVQITFDYPVMGEVLRLLKSAEATIHKQDLQLFCSIEAGIPLVHAAVLEKLSELRSVQLAPMQTDAT